MFGLGFTEILFLLFLALVLIGPKQLPEVARTLGRFLSDLKRTTNVLTEEMKQSIDKEAFHKSFAEIVKPEAKPDNKADLHHEPTKKDGSDHV